MIYDILPVNNYQGNNLSTIFDFDFSIDNPSQLKVYLYLDDGSKNELINGLDYLINDEEYFNGGNITFPIEGSSYGVLSENQKLSLELDIPASQETEYNKSSLLDLESLEYSFDYLTRLIQILKRKLSLCVKVDECSENTPQELMDSINLAHVATNSNATKVNEYLKQANQTLDKVLQTHSSTVETYENVKKINDDLIKNGIYKFNLFDTKITDCILDSNEMTGWALQGTYVSKEVYPDFYSVCLAQKEASEQTEVTLGESALTMFVNSNGHQFYNIVDKSIVDTFYETFGIADFYGIDQENERIFLPRNKYFAVTGEVPVAGNGMTLGITNGTTNYGLYAAGVGSDGNSGAIRATSNTYGTSVGSSGSGMCTLNKSYGITTDPTKSGIEAKLTPNENKYLYYCVGNTEVTQAITNVTEVTTSENDTIPLFTGMYFDFKPNNVSWLKAGVQQNNAGIYKTCYDTLVEIVNGVNNYDLKVINQADMVSGVIYDEYWILDQDNLTFRTPLTIATKSLSGGVVGNGNALGWTDGTLTGYPYGVADGNVRSAEYSGGGVPIVGASSKIGERLDNDLFMGVSTDTTKSGIVAEQSTAQLYFKVANAVQNLELLNAGEVLEAVADKISRQDCPAYIVETYKNGSSWYRIYSDGWCEQGGELSSVTKDSTTTVALLKSYQDANYSVFVQSLGGKRESTQYTNGQSVQSRNVDNFVLNIQDYAFGRTWIACGYKA